jgi:Spy/CpxP family protein refolding chaperone
MDPARMVERLREAVFELEGLTDDQRKQLEPIFSEATAAVKELAIELEGMDPRDRREQMREFTRSIREELAGILTEDQRQALAQRMEAGWGDRAGRRGDGPGAGPPDGDGASGRRGNGPIQRLLLAIEELNLTEEQKPKFRELSEELRSRVQELMALRDSDPDAFRAQSRELMQEAQQRAREILTPEQREQLRERMRQNAGDRAQRRQGSDAGDDRAMEPPPPPSGDAPPPPPPPSNPGGGRVQAPPDIGATIPAVAFTGLDGKTVQLSSFQGRIVVLVFGSYSCPSFRDRAADLERLRSEFANRAHFLIVYTREAHPLGEWEVERNRDEKVRIEPHADLEARRAMARDAVNRLKLTIPVLVDDMSDSAVAAWGLFPNGCVVLNRDGTVAYRARWTDPHALRRELSRLTRSA